MLEQHIDNEELIGHIIYFEAAFPKYELFIDELTVENSSYCIAGTHLAELSGIAPTNNGIDFPFVITYEIENNRIAGSWMIADQMKLMEQFGVVPATASH